MNGVGERYRDFSREQLLARIEALEKGKHNDGYDGIPDAESSGHGGVIATVGANEDGAERPKRKAARPFDITRYPCRKIALRFSYDGEAYSGLEMQTAAGSADGRAVETVESVLWKALCEARLVDDAVGLTGVGWSRCGRTDRGVSAAGQVVALWIRSKRVDEWPQRRAFERLQDEMKVNGAARDEDDGDETADLFTRRTWRTRVEERLGEIMQEQETEPERADRVHADPNGEELPYVLSINRLLPSTIRVQAWSPVSPGFNARFDCQYRHYKYFFTAGAPFVRTAHLYGPSPPLDIDAMRRAAQSFLGEHDFRNFCKVDPSKQMDNFFRRIDGISIDPVSRQWDPDEHQAQQQAQATTTLANEERMYVLNLRGTAFLYHQVRHIAAVLFLVGAGLEKPGIVDELLNVRPGGVYGDRVLSAKMNDLVLQQHDGAAVQTVLPPISAAANVNGDSVYRYQKIRETGQLDAEQAGLTPEQAALLIPLRDLFVYDRKPVYDMAWDRPLMLWECGFRDGDVEWRAGTYDGPMDLSSIQERAGQQHGRPVDVNGPTVHSRALMHGIWTAQAITTEVYRHFTLALPSDAVHASPSEQSGPATGHLPASTSFAAASFPALQSSVLTGSDEQVTQPNGHGTADGLSTRYLVPLGYGRFKTAPQYSPLRLVARQATPAEKNEKWKASRGQRRAEARAAKQQGPHQAKA